MIHGNVADDERPSPEPPAPVERRPPLIEMAAALLIVTGGIELASAIGVPLTGNLPAGAEGVLALSIALNVGTIAAGLLIRAGRLWLLVVNYVAVLGFLDLLRITASPVAFVTAIVDVVVLYVLFTNRSWFQRSSEPIDEAEPDAADD